MSNGYLGLLELAGWKYKAIPSPFVGQEKESRGYFVHAQTGRIVVASHEDPQRAAWSLVCDLTSQ